MIQNIFFNIPFELNLKKIFLFTYSFIVYQPSFCVQNGHLESGVGEDRFLRSTPLINPKGMAPAIKVTIQIKKTQICNQLYYCINIYILYKLREIISNSTKKINTNF